MIVADAASREWGEGVSTLSANLDVIDAILEHFRGSRAYAGLLAFHRSVNCLTRREFLRRLRSFLEDTMRLEAEVVCSVGAGTADSRRARLRGADCDGCEPDEHLIINLYGASRTGDLIPLVLFEGDDVELEGIINVAPSSAADEEGVREEVLHSSSQMLALIFRNVKLAARLFETCPKGKAAELDNLLRNYGGNSEMLVRRLRALAEPRTRKEPETGTPRRGIVARLLRFLRTWKGMTLTLIVLMLTTTFASYAELEPFNQPFNCAVAGVGKMTLGIPFSAGKKALDDGLLSVMVNTRDPRQIHDWLKGGNPGKIDYEEVLMKNGWDNDHLHRVGRILGMVP